MLLPKSIVNSPPIGRIAVGEAARGDHSLLELDIVVGSVCKACALVDSGASHNFLS